jgi:hypothetical protein
MSLWGNAPQYCQGAIVNARSIPQLLPGWTARFYCRVDVPEAVTRELADAGAEVVQGEQLDAVAPLMWRFLVHDDADADLYACRDSDSRIGEREIAAMMEWIESGRAFHVMRDHPFHNELMMGGMWGGTARTAISMTAEIDAFRQLHGPEHRYGVDQAFLAARIWPRIKDQLCTHDSYYQVGETRPFPGGARGTDRDHVGMGIVLAQLTT